MFVQLQAKVCKRFVTLEIVKSDLISYSHQLISLSEFFNFCKSYKIAFLLTRPTGTFLLNRVLNLLELNTGPSPSVLPTPVVGMLEPQEPLTRTPLELKTLSSGKVDVTRLLLRLHELPGRKEDGLLLPSAAREVR